MYGCSAAAVRATAPAARRHARPRPRPTRAPPPTGSRRPAVTTLRFSPADLLRCRFAYSPAFETLAAVRVATGPQPPGHHRRWLAGVGDALRGLDLRPLTLLQPRRGYTPDFLSPPPEGPADVADELARIAATPPLQARAEIARSLAETPGASGTATGRLLLDGEPAGVVALLAGLVADAWEALVEPYWPRTRALLEADIAFQARRLADGGLDRLFAELHPSVRWHDGVLTREHGGADHRDLHGEGLVLMPSAFKWDQVVIVLDPPWQPTLIYPARGVGNLWQEDAGADAHAAALARLVGRTRARLLAGLTEPAATAWLAHRYGLAPATVSEHLSVLRDTGLVTATRHRHEVRYRRTELGDLLAAGGGPQRASASTRKAAARAK